MHFTITRIVLSLSITVNSKIILHITNFESDMKSNEV